MERELKKTLMEIDNLIKDHERRGNTHTQSVLQIARDVIDPCAKAARTLPDLKEILERNESKQPIYQVQGDERYEQEPEWWECPNCGEVYDVDDDYDFCPNCGQRLMR
mgnify:CR=1 FL=1